MRVASKPAFAVLVGAVAFLAQDLFVRFTHLTISVDEGIAFVTILSYFAYWVTPVSMQDQAPALPAPPPLAPPVAPAA